MHKQKTQLLIKFLDESCSEAEIKEVESILRTQEGQELMRQIMIEDASRSEYSSQQGTEADEHLQKQAFGWLNKVHRRMEADQDRTIIPMRKNVSLRGFMRYAAVFAGLLITATIAIWQYQKNTDQQYDKATYTERFNKQGMPVKYLLPDSSEVYLAAGSKVRYPAQFAGDKRDVQLDGEAFFQVKPNPNKPFIIHTGEVQTRVLGTSFKVLAFKGQSLEVAVATGKVGVSETEKDKMKVLATLTPGQKVTYDHQTHEAKLGTVDVHQLQAWKAGELIFGDRLDVVAKALQRRFGITLKFVDSELAARRVSGSFLPNATSESVMEMLAFVGKFRYETKDGKTYMIYEMADN